MSDTDLNHVSQEFKTKIGVLTAFTSITLVAMIAWLIGSPLLAVVLDIGAMCAVLVTAISGRNSQSSRGYKHQG